MPGARSVLAKAVSAWRAEGLRGLTAGVTRRAYDRTEFVVFQRNLRTPPAPAASRVSFELRRVDDVLLERFGTMPAPYPRHREYRVVYGQRHCYAAHVGDRISALMWPLVQADNRRVVSRWRFLLEDECRLGSIWADPAIRGTGLIDACLERFAELFAARGFRYMYEFTWVGNTAAQRLYLRRGFKDVGRVRRYSLGFQREGHGLYLRSPIAREPVSSGHPGGDLELPGILYAEGASVQ
jgi:ribosomal protein S18 acetylase RimI-like enzyme